MKAIEYALASCETLMKKFAPEDLPPKGRFHYHQGVFLSGVLNTYRITKDERLFEYIKGWVDSCLDENGEPTHFDLSWLDDMQPGILLFDLYEKTKNPVYKRLLDKIIVYSKDLKKNPEGGFWHKGELPHQMWLDGMYMGGGVMTKYAVENGLDELLDTVYLQMKLMNKHNKDEKTGLYYHAWDYSKKEDWADAQTGRSGYFWGRALGWYVVAMFEIADLLPENDKRRVDFIESGIALVNALLKYQDAESGMWYQIVDRTDDERNWTEVSCSCLILYAMCIAVRIGALDKEEMRGVITKCYQGVIDTLNIEGDYIGVRKVCVGTNVGDYEFYLNRPTSENDLHGVGAFLLAVAEYSKVYED